MADFSPFFQLSTIDLLEKLRRDLMRLEADPANPFEAFNFFVTAHHLTDWLCPGLDEKSKKARRRLVASSAALSACAHIATGAKHYRVDAKHMNSVEATKVHSGGLSSEFSREFDTSRLQVRLKGKAAKVLGTQVDAVDLASEVLAFWEANLSVSP